MTLLTNPFDFSPALGSHFVGRNDVLARWSSRLSDGTEEWRNSTGWLLVGPAGIGKTSLLKRLKAYAEDRFGASTVYVDLGLMYQLDSLDDLIANFRSQLPRAHRLGTRLRQWLNTGLDAPSSMVITKAFWTTVKGLAVGLSPAAWKGFGLEFGNLTRNAEREVGTFARFLDLFNDLAVLSEEHPSPVVIALDRIGDVYDNKRWTFIIEMLMGLQQRVRHAGSSNVVFVYALRPEQKGLLEWETNHLIFGPEHLDTVTLKPFTHDEAIDAIGVRAGALIPRTVAGWILDALDPEANVADPYAVVMGAWSVWQFLYGKEGLESATTLSKDSVLDIVSKGQDRLLRAARRDPAQWLVLENLALYPGSSVEEIAKATPPLSISEVRSAIDNLTDPVGYRLLSSDLDEHGRPRYSISHGLLAEMVLREIPAQRRIVQQTKRLLADVEWRYSVHGHLLTSSELNEIWATHEHLEYSGASWEAIIVSGLYVSEPTILSWLHTYPGSVEALCQLSDEKATSPLALARLRVLQICFCRTSGYYVKFVQSLLQYPASVVDCEELFDLIAETGQEAYEFLEAMAKSRIDLIAPSAVRALAKLGRRSIPLFSELSTSGRDETQVEAAVSLVRLGEIEAGLAPLKEIAEGGPYLLRLVTIQQLGRLGRLALPILSDLAHARDYVRRLEAFRAIASIGHEAVPFLRTLAAESTDTNIQFWTARELLVHGHVSEAVSTLLRLLMSSPDDIREAAALSLVESGQAGLRRLDELSDLKVPDKVHVAVSRALALSQVTSSLTADPGLLYIDRGIGRLKLVRLLMAANRLDQAERVLLEFSKTPPAWQTSDVINYLLGVPHLAPRILPGIVEAKNRQLISPDIFRILGRFGDLGQSILRNLMDSSPDQNRILAALHLALLGEKDEAEVILSKAAQSASFAAWAIALPTLPALGDAGLALVIQMLHRFNTRFEHIPIVSSLAKFGPPAHPVLVRIVQTHPLREVRLEACKGLVGTEHAKIALVALMEMAWEAPDANPRMSIALLRLAINSLMDSRNVPDG